MPNRNYVNGRAREYRAIRLLERSGHLAFRTAGSHSPFDVVAITGTVVRLIQLKSGDARLSGVEREALELIEVPPNVSKESWRWPKRADPIITRIR